MTNEMENDKLWETISRAAAANSAWKPKNPRLPIQARLVSDDPQDRDPSLRPFNWHGSARHTAKSEKQAEDFASQGTQTLSAVVARPKKYVFKKLILSEALNLIFGESGAGKGTFTNALAACLSVNQPLHPDVTPAGSAHTIIISFEDDPETDIKPRVYAHGADLNRVHVFGRDFFSDEMGNPLPFCSEKTLQKIQGFTNLKCRNDDESDEHKGNNLGMLVIDHISMIVDGNIDNDKMMRKALDSLANWAKTLSCAVVVISHTRERAGGKSALHQSFGSAAVRQIPRESLFMTPIRSGPTATGGTHMLIRARNVSGVNRGIEFRTEKCHVELDGKIIETRRCVITAVREGNDRELVEFADAPASKDSARHEQETLREKAIRILVETLNNRVLIFSADLKRIVMSFGISEGTYNAARRHVPTFNRRYKGATILALNEASFSEEAMAALVPLENRAAPGGND
jgi:hypothetical protein